MNFRELREKSIKGISLQRYLENPTPNEFYRFMKNTKAVSVRGLWFKDTMYVWDAYDMTHDYFVLQELQTTKFGPEDERAAYEIDNRFNIDLYDREEGTIIAQRILRNPHAMSIIDGVIENVRKYDDLVLKSTVIKWDSQLYYFIAPDKPTEKRGVTQADKDLLSDLGITK